MIDESADIGIPPIIYKYNLISDSSKLTIRLKRKNG